MKNLIKLFFNINRVSFFLIILPFITFNLFTFLNSQYFNLVNLFIFFLSFVFIDLLIKLILEYLLFFKFFAALFFSALIIFFYGYYLVSFFQKIFLNNFEVFPRGRYILFVIFLVMIGVQVVFIKINYIRYFNVFLIIFTIINFTINFKNMNYSNLGISQLDNEFHKIDLSDKSKKPVVLIVSDEYSSPDELFGVYEDSSVYDFSNYLKNTNWLVRNSSVSHETSTIHSIGSLFNFNVSKKSNYSEVNIYDIGSKFLLKSSFYDSLKINKINFINFGILRVGNSDPVYNLYKYPKNFIELILINTIYFHFVNNTELREFKNFNNDFYPIEAHNKFILDFMIDSLSNSEKSTFFTYAHLYMPHSPYSFEKEFDKPLINNTKSYFEYWKFTNNKLKILLSMLTRSDKYRIILTGDHGYRENSMINPNNTFTAFYGFSDEDLSSISSVQDLGILIYSCY